MFTEKDEKAFLVRTQKNNNQRTALADLIRSGREKTSMTQAQLADLIGVSPAAVGTAEAQHFTGNGVTAAGIGIEHMARIARVLKCRESEAVDAANLSARRFAVPNLSPAHARAGVALEKAWEALTAEDLAKIEGLAARRSGE